MKIEIDEYGPFIIISIGGNRCLCETEEFIHDDDNFIDNTGYMHVWNKVCRDIFGSWFIRSKNIIAEGYAILYPLSRFKILSDQQINHFTFIADIANLEMGRIDSLIAARDKEKHGEQLNILDKV